MTSIRVIIGSWLLALASPALASAPAGVWIIPDRVLLTPNADAPSTIQIEGIATLHSGRGPIADWGYDGFDEPRRGTLFYSCPAGQSELCALQWRELAAARGRCVGFGSLEEGSGRLREAVAQSDAPDVYPVGMGVVEGFTPCRVLQAALERGVPSAPAAGSSAGHPPEASTAGAEPSGDAPEPAAPSHVRSGCQVAGAGAAARSLPALAGVLAPVAWRVGRRRDRASRSARPQP